MLEKAGTLIFVDTIFFSKLVSNTSTLHMQLPCLNIYFEPKQFNEQS